MKVLLSTLVLACSLQVSAQTDSVKTIKRVNKALSTILDSLLKDQTKHVLLKDEKGNFLKDEEGNRLTEVKIDEDYTDLENNHIKFGARITLNTSRWSPGKQSGLGLWFYGNLKREEKTATIGVNSVLETDTIAVAKFLLANAVNEIWEDGVPETADFFETAAYHNLKTASTKLQSLEELYGILIFLKGGLLNVYKQTGEDLTFSKFLSKDDIDFMKSLNAVEFSFQNEELTIAYKEELDEQKPAGAFFKDLSLAKSEVTLTKTKSQLTLELVFSNLKDEDFDDWEAQKEQGMGMVEMFLPMVEGSPEQVAGFTKDLKNYIDRTINFLTNEDAEFDFF